MRIFESYKPGGHTFNKSLLWEYDVEDIDFQKCRRLVVSRVIELGRLEDFYAAFGLLTRLMQEPLLGDTRLVGGTSLACRRLFVRGRVS